MKQPILKTNDMTYKTPMFIDFHKGEERMEFHFKKMDINDVKIFSDALDLLEKRANESVEKLPFLTERIKSIKKEFKDNIYTQNIRLPLVPEVYHKTNKCCHPSEYRWQGDNNNPFFCGLCGHNF